MVGRFSFVMSDRISFTVWFHPHPRPLSLYRSCLARERGVRAKDLSPLPLERGRGWGILRRKNLTHHGDQLFRVERLGQIGDGAKLQAAEQIVVVALCAEQDDGYGRRIGV